MVERQCTPSRKKYAHLLDVVVAQCAPVLQLLAGEDQPLLVWRDALLILDLALHIVDRIAALHFERDGLPGY